MTTALRSYAIDRIPFHLHWTEKSSFKETYGGGFDQVIVEGQYLKPKDAPPSKTIWPRLK